VKGFGCLLEWYAQEQGSEAKCYYPLLPELEWIKPCGGLHINHKLKLGLRVSRLTAGLLLVLSFAAGYLLAACCLVRPLGINARTDLHERIAGAA
jgi:hypothetical protein